MNILIFTHEMPFPATNGGRLDIWNRIKAFKSLKHKVFLVAWAVYDDNKREKNIIRVREVVDELVVYKRKSDLINRSINLINKLRNLTKQPNVVTDCDLSQLDFKRLMEKIKMFGPNLILVDQIYAGKIGIRYSKILNIPIFVRSH